ncbi:beta-lactamase (penicillin-binding protein) (penicillinase) [Erythrobacter sp. NAP1]|uniref:serine hydrolase domain-containing protein n=1 Tax=Erythrobacter sp. NAP1 TaxID=237727 RepID=UPI0000686EC3|nr:serine hydrolase domain-containing protein [Erythrobacter sp. NAP1]EAQ30709.1 beta-lactamase (penicillin-binding protein) (penicillinase) [Erythrobacter sp. NAP1]
MLVTPRPFAICFAAMVALSTPTLGHAQETEASGVELTRADLDAQLDAIMTQGGYSGVVYVQMDGEPVVEKAYGVANPASGRANEVDTIFGIGSRPIDFTKAAIFLLADEGKLSLDDRLDKYYPDAPADRAGMTIRHMLTGQSGLPDFPAQPGDADADLTWIDRAEFERRTMQTPLLFAPGESEAHSHWAFGLASAIVERVSGEPYAQFLRSRFFEPAGMTRTGDYGERGEHQLEDFAVGGGKQVGLPNIPPNWGPTSWLVLGSGGMYSNLSDLRNFYAYVTDGGVLSAEHAAHFRQINASVDGSERGFELFSFNDEGRRNETFVFLNGGGQQAVEALAGPLIALLRGQ